jgi:hypothetical protein
MKIPVIDELIKQTSEIPLKRRTRKSRIKLPVTRPGDGMHDSP